MKKLKLGKLPSSLLAELLEKYSGARDARLAVGPKVGEDAAAIDFNDRYLIAKTDPITFVTDEIGWYAVNVNANDIATRGSRPRWFQATILLPENKTRKETVEKIFYQISHACKELGIAIVGGHTEVTYGLDRPIVVGNMFGEVEKEKLIETSGARPNDDVVITKGIVIEGTSIIAREKEKELKKKGYSQSFIEKCKSHLYNISVVKDALVASETVRVHCMHDPTEGGLANGLYEIAQASGTGMLIYKDRIPILKESEILCKEYNLNLLGTITSGTLVLTLPPEETGKLLRKYKNVGIEASLIGKVKEKNYGVKILDSGKLRDLEYSEKDEITKIFEE
jgi:hydrogenase maturation factor